MTTQGTTQALPGDAGPALATGDAAVAERDQARPRRGISFVDAATLALIGVVVVLVSLPRLRRFALRENETDAIAMLRVLATDAQAHGEILAAEGLGALLAASSAQRVRLEDVEVLEEGRLRRHGYVFESILTDDGRRILIAWPWDHGRTGLGVFAEELGGPVVGLENAEGHYSGLERPPPVPPRDLGAPWRALPGS